MVLEDLDNANGRHLINQANLVVQTQTDFRRKIYDFSLLSPAVMELR